MRAAPVVLTLALLAGACDTPYTTTDKETCQLLAQSLCKKTEQCIYHGVENGYGDEATCEKLQLAQCKAKFEANHTGEHSSELVTCVTALAAASCADFEENTLDACQPSPGTAANGAPCAYSIQCGSNFCAVATNSTCGTCAALSEAGDDCSTHSCSPGFTCVAATMTCQAPSSSGDPCNDEEPCGFALSCVTPAGATSGTCAEARQVAGYPCDPLEQTAPGCDANSGLVCDPSTNTCVMLTYATTGEPCGDVSGTTVVCETKSACFGASGTTSGTCLAFAAVDAACNTSTGPACAPPAVCVTGSPTSTAGTCKNFDASMCR